jgi:hypothetical protein
MSAVKRVEFISTRMSYVRGSQPFSDHSPVNYFLYKTAQYN